MRGLKPMIFAIAAATLAAPAVAREPADEATLRMVDERQRQLIAARDAAGMRNLAHPNLRINAPTNQVLTGQQLTTMMASGEVAAEQFVRVPESVIITANVGVVMGHETFTATADSASGRMFGAVPLKRRYTNIYLHEGGRWRFLARHANVAPTPRGVAR
jgi:hypothetical protein